MLYLKVVELFFDRHFFFLFNIAYRFNLRYDYWYQPYHNVMISTEWGHPR